MRVFQNMTLFHAPCHDITLGKETITAAFAIAITVEQSVGNWH